MGYGKNLKNLLKDRNITIKELAELSGLSLNSLYSITKRDPLTINANTLHKIANGLNMTDTELISYLIMDSETSKTYYDKEKDMLELEKFFEDVSEPLKRKISLSETSFIKAFLELDEDDRNTR